MANATIPPSPFYPQFRAARNLDTRDLAQQCFALARGCSLYIAIIQQPVRKWEKPWRHQRAIVLLAKSPEETKLRLQLEGRMKRGELVLQIVPVGE